MNVARSARHRSAAVIAAALLAAFATPAGAHGPDPTFSGSLWTQNESLTFRWRSGSEPPASIRSAILAAADDANSTRASKAATFAYASGGTSPIGYGAGATCGPNGIACFTRTAPTGFTMWLREHGRVFDWGTLRWCQALATPVNGCYDAETIALDEFGHVEILNHHVNHADDSDYLDAVVQTFSRTRPAAGWNMHVFGRCDVATLQREYDMPSWTTKYSTCLDLTTVVTLAVNDASIPYGATATFTATLKVEDLAAYERLGANPISSRTVILQRKAPSASTWTNIGTMTPGSTSGTYTMAVRLTSDTHLRAWFDAPSSEGLRSDTSNWVRMDVSGCAQPPCPLSGDL